VGARMLLGDMSESGSLRCEHLDRRRATSRSPVLL
jgi:hypothetical protein